MLQVKGSIYKMVSDDGPTIFTACQDFFGARELFVFIASRTSYHIEMCAIVDPARKTNSTAIRTLTLL